MMYITRSTRVTLASVSSAPDLGALTPGRATEVGSYDDLASSNPPGREAGDVLNTDVAHVSINAIIATSITSSSSSPTGPSLQTPLVRPTHTRASINKKDLRKSCQKNIVKCTDFTYIGTLNVRTIRLEYKQRELAHRFASSGLEMMAIQEHRIVHAEPTKTTILGSNAYLLTTSAWRNAAGASTGGVGIILTKKAHDIVTELHTVSPRIFGVTLDGNPRCTMFSVYSPTECANDDAAEEFHNELRATLASIPAHNLVAVGGDFNAHVGKEDDNDNG